MYIKNVIHGSYILGSTTFILSTGIRYNFLRENKKIDFNTVKKDIVSGTTLGGLLGGSLTNPHITLGVGIFIVSGYYIYQKRK